MSTSCGSLNPLLDNLTFDDQDIGFAKRPR